MNITASGLPVRRGAGEAVAQPVGEELAVRQVREHVVVGVELDLFFGALPVADVDDRGVDHAGHAVADQDEVLQHPERRAVGAPQLDLDAVERAGARAAARSAPRARWRSRSSSTPSTADSSARREAEHRRECRVAVDDRAVESADADAGGVLLEQQPVADLRLAQRGLGGEARGDVAEAPDADRLDVLHAPADRVALETAPVLELEEIEALRLRLRVERVDRAA